MAGSSLFLVGLGSPFPWGGEGAAAAGSWRLPLGSGPCRDPRCPRLLECVTWLRQCGGVTPQEPLASDQQPQLGLGAHRA